jgi:hypothetical protein
MHSALAFSAAIVVAFLSLTDGRPTGQWERAPVLAVFR